MERWLDAAAAELEVSPDMDGDLLLEVARSVAHSVERRATPLTTYLIGAAVASGMDPVEACRRIQDLAAGWSSDADGPGS